MFDSISTLHLRLTALLLSLWVTLTVRVTARRVRDDRGDVPGWVLVTVMSAGLVGALSIVASEELSGLLRRALNQVQ